MQLEQRNETLERNFSELTQRLLQTQAGEAELRDQLASALPREKQEELENRISELTRSEAQLTVSNNQLKEVAEVARQQAVAVETMQKSRDLELVSLRHQLLDLQGTSDEKTALGRVHHQLLSHQVSEAAALKKLEVTDAKVKSYAYSAIYNCRGSVMLPVGISCPLLLQFRLSLADWGVAMGLALPPLFCSCGWVLSRSLSSLLDHGHPHPLSLFLEANVTPLILFKLIFPLG